ncbi:MAG: hypothetical protein ACJ8FY_25455 [Gemmataceae bacterium]
MSRSHVFTFAFVALLAMFGCARQQLPGNQKPPKDQADLEARYERIEIGTPEPEIAAFLGKRGADVAGYSTQVVKRKPEGGSDMAAGESHKYWASEDSQGAIRVVFGSDGKARSIQLLRLRPMGPAPGPREESKGP